MPKNYPKGNDRMRPDFHGKEEKPRLIVAKIHELPEEDWPEEFDLKGVKGLHPDEMERRRKEIAALKKGQNNYNDDWENFRHHTS